MSFIEILKGLINQKGITKNKMLTDLKIGKNSFVNWESRGTIPSAKTVSKIADYFGVTTDYLLGKEQKNKPTDPNGELKDKIKDLVNQLSTQEALESALGRIVTLLDVQDNKDKK